MLLCNSKHKYIGISGCCTTTGRRMRWQILCEIKKKLWRMNELKYMPVRVGLALCFCCVLMLMLTAVCSPLKYWNSKLWHGIIWCGAVESHLTVYELAGWRKTLNEKLVCVKMVDAQWFRKVLQFRSFSTFFSGGLHSHTQTPTLHKRQQMVSSIILFATYLTVLTAHK